MVSVVIASYNTEKLLRNCLISVQDKLKNITHEIIVVDNASSDQTVSMVEKEFNKVSIIKNKENMGFGNGINRGAKEAIGEYLLFLNSDATLLDSNIKEMIEILEQENKVGVVGGRLENVFGASSGSYGSFPSVLSVFKMLFLWKKSELSSMEKVKQVDWISGGFMLICTSLFKTLGGFDEDFFMYYEDVELCYRIKKRGLQVFYYPKAKAQHQGQGSSSRTFAIVSIYKGVRTFCKKHKNRLSYELINVLFVAKAIAAIIIGSLTQNKYLVHTYRDALRA